MKCGKCFTRIDEWVDLANEGTVSAFTIVRQSSPLHPCDPPFAYALITLDGATTRFLHIIKNDLDNLVKGARVRAEFVTDGKGSIMDIEAFTIIP
jgi:hypothetical protein